VSAVPSKLSVSSIRFGVVFIALVAFVLATRVITTVPPEKATVQDQLTVALSVLAILTIVGAPLIQLFYKRRVPASLVSAKWRVSFRQSFLISLLITTILSMRWYGIFSFWDAIPLTIATLLLEFFFQAEKRPLATIRHES
jgi:hypothetical protein